MTVTVVVNPASGGGRAGQMLPEVLARLRRRTPADMDDGPLVVRRTADWDDAIATTREAGAQLSGKSGRDALVVIGGDGLVHLGLNACAGSATVLTVVPAGTGNDLARGVGLDPRTPLQAVDALIDGAIRAVDLIDTGSAAHLAADGVTGDHQTVAQRFVGSVVASGFDALVNLRANRMTRPQGSMRYTLATLLELPTFAPLPYRLELDGQIREVEAMLVAVGNTSAYGGGMNICPEATPDDGVLDLTIIHAASRRLLLQLLPKMRSGEFARHRVVEQVRARRVELAGDRVSRSGKIIGPLTAMGDGEVIGPLPRTLSVAPAAVTIAAPTRQIAAPTS